MSEPGTNVEIEDVLTSIRRLVSQDAAMQPPGAVHRPAPPLRAEKVEEPETALLLTPAQRIEAEPPAPEVVAEDVVAESEVPEPAPVAPRKSDILVLRPAPDLGEELSRLETTIAEMEAAVVDSDEEFEPEHGDPFEPEGSAPLEELPEQFDAAVFAPQTAEQPAADLPEQILKDLSDEVLAQVATEVTDALTPEVAEDLPDAEAELAAWEADLTAEVAAVEPTPEAWPGLTEARMVAAVSPAAPQDAAETNFISNWRGAGTEEEAAAVEPPVAPIMPEAELRALIAEVVRQELQGTLGERITRNVRKLVRREIYRVLGTEEG